MELEPAVLAQKTVVLVKSPAVESVMLVKVDAGKSAINVKNVLWKTATYAQQQNARLVNLATFMIEEDAQLAYPTVENVSAPQVASVVMKNIS